MFGVHMTVSKVQEHSKQQKRKLEERRQMMTEAFTLQHIGKGITDVPEDLYATMQKRFQENEEEEKLMMEIEDNVKNGDAKPSKNGSESRPKTDSCAKLNNRLSYLSDSGSDIKENMTKRSNDDVSKGASYESFVERTEQLIRILSKMQKTMVEARDAMFTLCTHVQDKDEREEARDEKATEWHQVAVALDRTFFFLYLACLIVLAIVSSAILFPRAI